MDRDLQQAPIAVEDDVPSDAIEICQSEFATAVLAGFARKPRAIPSRFFYDERGAALFEEITALPEYYLTRAETALLQDNGAEIAECMGPARVLVEFGSGSSRKTSLLLEALAQVDLYIPIDIAGESLAEAADRLGAQHDGLTIRPLVADFTRTQRLPLLTRGWRKLGFFSGSTIGNLTREDAHAFLENAAALLERGSAFLVGVDTKKDLATLLPAYNDSAGITASFNLNLLTRINRELDGDIDPDRFAHVAIYDERHGRIEMHLESLVRQTVHVLGEPFRLDRGERIHTENSHKYSVPEFQALARASGWTPMRAWTDAERLFSLHLLELR